MKRFAAGEPFTKRAGRTEEEEPARPLSTRPRDRFDTAECFARPFVDDLACCTLRLPDEREEPALRLLELELRPRLPLTIEDLAFFFRDLEPFNDRNSVCCAGVIWDRPCM